MSAKWHSFLSRILTVLRYGILASLATVIILCLNVIVFIACIVIFALALQRSDFNEKLDYAYHLDHQQFPMLKEPILIFSRNHSSLGGNVVLVYDLKKYDQRYFQTKIQQEGLSDRIIVECVTPTIKKRWRGLRTTLHYVQPNSAFKDHHDYLNHDSFFVHGSTKYLQKAERACQQPFQVIKTIKGAKYKNFSHSYWAMSEKENLLFSVYYTED